MNNEDKEFQQKLNKIIQENPELRNFNLEFLKEISADELDVIVGKLKTASINFNKAEQTAKDVVKNLPISDFRKLKIEYNNFLYTLANFPFALAVGDNILNDTSESGNYSAYYFGIKISFDYNNIYELISIKKFIAMNTAKLMQRNIKKFLPLKDKINNYLRNITNHYLKQYELNNLFTISAIKEFNFLVILENNKYDSVQDFYKNHLNGEIVEAYRYFKAYLITEFSIAIIEKKKEL